MERLADALPLERAASRWIVSSDPEEQVEKIRPYVELGFRHLVFHAPGPDQARFLKLYAEQVLPPLRKTLRLMAATASQRGLTGHRCARVLARHAGDRCDAGRSTSRRALIAATICDTLAASRRCAETATCWSWRRRSSRRPRAAWSMSRRSSRRRSAVALAAEVEKDPRLVEVILSESRRIVRHRPNLMIAEHRLRLRHGQCRHRPFQRRARRRRRARAAAAASIPTPRPKRCARSSRRAPASASRVIISDSFGRPFRRGTVGIALGAAGLPAVIDLARPPRPVRPQAAKSPRPVSPTRSPPPRRWCMGQADEAMPIVLVRGLNWTAPATPAAELVRPPPRTCSANLFSSFLSPLPPGGEVG